MNPTEIIDYWETKYSSGGGVESNFNLQPLLNGFLSAFSPGHSYHYVLNFKALQLRFISPSVREFIGVSPEKVTLHDLLAVAGEEQLKVIKVKEQVTHDFFFNYLPREELHDYKVTYLYKMKDHQGKSRVMLAQAIPLSLDSKGNLEDVLSVHADVSYLRIQPNTYVSFFNLKGGKSFVNINAEAGRFDPDGQSGQQVFGELTPRENEVISFLAKGLRSKEIAAKLHVSEHTVRKHRKNMLKKTNCSNTSELVSKFIMSGLWV